MELSIINAFKDHTHPFDNYEQILTRICNAYDFQTKLIKNSDSDDGAVAFVFNVSLE